jgi:hypothetical protein
MKSVGIAASTVSLIFFAYRVTQDFKVSLISNLFDF